MKTIKLIAFLLFLPLLSCDSDDTRNSEIPSVVLNSFNLKYPDAVDVSWEEKEEGHEADFEVGNIDYKALLAPTGELLQLKHEISLQDVPEEVFSSLRKNFKPKDFEDPEKVMIGSNTYYQLEIDQFLLDEKVVLDEKGKISKNVNYWD